jgi:glycosyltransferase involved in cell wall biosynthesis
MTRIAAVLWSGSLGGAETFTVDLCRAVSELGVEVGVVFVTHGEPLEERLALAGIPHTSLGLARGREVTHHPMALATCVKDLAPDCSVLPHGGYLAAALRLGGYRGRIVSVAHDATLDLGRVTFRDRLVHLVDRVSGFWASNVDVAVSEFVLTQMARRPRPGRLVRIYNGVDLRLYTDHPGPSDREAVKIAYAGRLVQGKGVDILLRAFATGAVHEGAVLRIAGDGPAREMLQELADELGVNGAVEFTGWTLDMPSFWRECDLAVMPSDGSVESFGMAAVEAMACARPVVATANGALPELVDDGVTGLLVPRGDRVALADALVTLTRDSERRRAAGRAARARCEQRFDIRDCAASYVKLFQT